MGDTAISPGGGGGGKTGNKKFTKGSRGTLLYVVREAVAKAMADKDGQLAPLIVDAFNRLHVKDSQIPDVVNALGAITDSNTFLQTLVNGIKVASIAAGSNRIGTVSGQLVAVADEKIVLCSGAYDAEDVVSESTTAGKAWHFANVARVEGGGGYLMDSVLLAQTTGIAGWFSLYLFTRKPTCALNDDAANTAVLAADRKYFVARIDYPACSDLGTGAPDTSATPSTIGGLPKSFVCEKGSRDLWGVMVIRNAVDLADSTWLRASLNIEQY